MMDPNDGKISEAAVALREQLIKRGCDPLKAHEGMSLASIKQLRRELDMENWPIFEVGEEIEIKGHKFKLRNIDTKHHQLVFVSSELKRVL